jgi:hypothetical protein
MEALGKLISTAVSGGLFSDFSMGTGVDISHLLFAYDTLTKIIFTFDGAYFYYLRLCQV